MILISEGIVNNILKWSAQSVGTYGKEVRDIGVSITLIEVSVRLN
jgi:hypothetical protein